MISLQKNAIQHNCSYLSPGIMLGIQLGEQRGIEKGKLEVARTMLQNGIDRNIVMKMTGLTEDDMAQIRH